MSLVNLKMGGRLGLGFGVVLLLLISVAFLGIKGMESADAALEEIIDDNVHKMQLVQDMSELVHIFAHVSRTLVLITDVQPRNGAGRSG